MSPNSDHTTILPAPTAGLRSSVKPSHLLAAWLIFLLSLTSALLIFFNRTALADRISLIGYQPSAEALALEESLNLTPAASLIFRASRPSLDSRTTFNESCSSHNPDVSVLGCYTGDTIHLYAIETTELPGIVESTAAHELLHAVWSRTPSWERTDLIAAMEVVYNAHQSTLAADLQYYADDKKWDELHSRIGTEIADLPTALEKHYQKYFRDQDAIVALYDSYSEPFLKLRAEIDQLAEQIDQQKAYVTEQTAIQTAAIDQLNREIDQFNTCANTAGCITDISEFTAQRRQLLAKQTKLKTDYDSLQSAIDQLNALILQYNSNILRSVDLENAINSNSTINETKGNYE